MREYQVLTSWSSIVGSVGQVASFLITTSVLLNLLDLLANGVQLRIDSRRRLIQLHQKVQRANLELRFVDL